MPVSPTLRAPRLRRRLHVRQPRAGASLGDRVEADRPPAWFPTAARGGRPGRAARARRARLGPVAGARSHAAPPRPRMDGGADHHRRAHHHRHGAHLDRHRADAGRARRHRLPDGGRAATCSTSCGGPRAEGDAREVDPARVDPVRAWPSVASGRRSWCGPSSRHAASPGPTSAAAATCRTGCPRRCWPRSPTCCARASPSCTPTTTASTRSPTSTAWPRSTTPSWCPSTAWSAYLSRSCPPGAALVITADHGQVDVGDRVIPPHPEVLGRVVAPVGRGPVPVAARPAGRRPTTCSTAAPSTTATSPGSCRRDQVARRAAGSGPMVARRDRRRVSATWRWWPATPWRSTTRPTPGRSSSWAATAR